MPEDGEEGRYAFTAADASVQAVRQLIAIADPASCDASLNIAHDDDMFTYGVGFIGFKPAAVISYFREGMSIVGLIEQVAAWRFGGWDGVGSLLDFASGYGRSTRFLVQHLPAGRVTVSEIQRDALEFQRREFGVRTMASAGDPDELESTAAYDLVFVASLFTHLPDRTFGKWLARLWTLVAPGGALVFSVHDEAINRGSVPLEDGFGFIPRSELSTISTEDYGTTFTTEDYVRRRLSEAIGSEADDAVRLPRALCFEQDVWVVPRGGAPTAALEYECGPIGAIDRFDVRGRMLEASGWAADRGAAAASAPTHEIARVEVLVNGAPAGPMDVEWAMRPDVAHHLGDGDEPRFRRSGWTLRGRCDRRLRADDVLSFVAICEHGASFVMDSSRVGDLLRGIALPASTSRTGRYAMGARHLFGQGGVRAVAGRIPVVLARDLRPLLRRPSRSHEPVLGSVSLMSTPPLPDAELARRVGVVDQDNPVTSFDELGAATKQTLVALQPDGWFAGRRILDFGCGSGKLLRHLLPEAERCEIHGCDIHEPSIDWVRQTLVPPMHVFVNGETPPLPFPDEHFDLIWAVSVFTHLTTHWADWLLELHRVLTPDGRLVATFLGEGMSESIANEPWHRDRIGMNVLRAWQPWDQGGPSVQHSEWWLREHWGRIFTVERLEDRPHFGHGLVVLSKREASATREDLMAPADDPREIAAVRHNVEQVTEEAAALAQDRDAWRDRLHATEGQLSVIAESRSWRLTAPLRALRARRP